MGWHWLAIIALSMTPNLILGQSIAAVLGVRWHLPVAPLIAVMAVFGYLEGVGVAYLSERFTRIGFVQRLVVRTRKPRVVAFAQRWGPWGGLTLGLAFAGQEPVLLALRWLGVEMRRLWVPLAVGNVMSALGYYWLVRAGLVWT
jgi:hypothetical protein